MKEKKKMINKISKFIILFAILILTISCVQSDNRMGMPQFEAWIFEPENGLIVDKKTKMLTLRLQYLPSQYYDAKTFVNSFDTNNRDRVSSKENLIFLLTISSDAQTLSKNPFPFISESYAEYEEKIRYLQFQLQQEILLKLGDSAEYIKPIAVHFEHVPNAEMHHATIIFERKFTNLYNLKNINITWFDKIFGSGVVSFKFDCKNIVRAEKINIIS